MVFVFRNPKLGIRIKLSDCSKINIAPKDRNADRLFGSEILEILDKIISFVFVMPCCPVIVQVIEDLDTAIELIQDPAFE